MKKLILAGLVLIGAGCINYTSLTKIESDGSGTLCIVVEVPQMENTYLSVIDFEVKDSIQGWETTLISSDTLDTSIVYRLEGNFESPDVLARVFDIDGLVFEKKEAGDVIQYHLNKPPVYLPGTRFEGVFESTGSLIKAAIKYGSDDYLWTEKLVLPGKIIEHNANKRKNDTLIWKVDAMDLVKEGVVVDVVWEVPR
jgi:hypothetical protein